MSAMPSEKLREPEQLYVPPSSKGRELHDVLDHLTPEGGKEFARQVMAAIKESQETNDLRPINTVVESWYRSLVFDGRPEFDEKWAAAEEVSLSGPRLNLDGIRQRRAQRHA